MKNKKTKIWTLTFITLILIFLITSFVIIYTKVPVPQDYIKFVIIIVSCITTLSGAYLGVNFGVKWAISKFFHSELQEPTGGIVPDEK